MGSSMWIQVWWQYHIVLLLLSPCLITRVYEKAIEVVLMMKSLQNIFWNVISRWVKHSFPATSSKFLQWNTVKILGISTIYFFVQKLDINRLNDCRPSEKKKTKKLFIEYMGVIYSYCWFNSFIGLFNALKMFLPLPWDSHWWQNKLYNDKLNSITFVSTIAEKHYWCFW